MQALNTFTVNRFHLRDWLMFLGQRRRRREGKDNLIKVTEKPLLHFLSLFFSFYLSPFLLKQIFRFTFEWEKWLEYDILKQLRQHVEGKIERSSLKSRRIPFNYLQEALPPLGKWKTQSCPTKWVSGRSVNISPCRRVLTFSKL